MLKGAPVRAVIAVSDIDKAKAFYTEKLGLTFVEENPGGLTVQAGDGTFLEIYPTQFAGTAKNTVAGFEVQDLEAAMSDLRGRGIAFEEYDLPDLKMENGIAHIGPKRGAWFKDPDGNTFGLIQRG
jgi:catechol 2,3-dioxygenase-like lactoylglutathione lyase family enzyme